MYENALAWTFLSRGWVAKMAFEKYSKPRCALSFTTFPCAISSSRRFAESSSKTAASFSMSSEVLALKQQGVAPY